MYLIFFLYILFASVFTLQKQTLNYAEPFFLIGVRMILAGLFLLLIYLIINITEKKFMIKKKHIYIFFLYSFTGFYLTNVCEIWGMTVMDSSKACLIYNLSPFFTAFLSFIILKEKLNKKQLLGLSLGFLSMFTMNKIKSVQEQYLKVILFLSPYELSLLSAVILSVLGWVVLKKLINLGYPILIINSYSMFFGGFLSILHSYFFDCCWNPIPIYCFKHFILYTLITCVTSNLICYNLFAYLLQKYTITLLTFFGLLTPIFSLIFGYIFLNENINYYFFVTLILIFLGLLIFYKEEKNKK